MFSTNNNWLGCIEYITIKSRKWRNFLELPLSHLYSICFQNLISIRGTWIYVELVQKILNIFVKQRRVKRRKPNQKSLCYNHIIRKCWFSMTFRNSETQIYTPCTNRLREVWNKCISNWNNRWNVCMSSKRATKKVNGSIQNWWDDWRTDFYGYEYIFLDCWQEILELSIFNLSFHGQIKHFEKYS